MVRLPNWLGDLVMSVGFLQQLRAVYPDAHISVIVKKGLHELLPLFPPIEHLFVFDKTVYKGLRGAWRFGREIKKKDRFDLFFCLPDSLSSGVMGWVSGAKERIGYGGEGRTFLFTHVYKKPKGLHRANVYKALLERYTGKTLLQTPVRLQHAFSKEDYLVVNINSEASSRRLTEEKAVELLHALQHAVPQKIILVGAIKETAFVDGVLKKLPSQNIESRAGKTNLPQLVQLLASAKLLLTTDSGPAHLANALGTHTIVLFGAGNEQETAPYNKELRTVIRLGQLSCEPCEKNICVRYGIPQCLERLSSARIITEVTARLNQT